MNLFSVGQFWNIPVTATYIGKSLSFDIPYRVTVYPPKRSPRTFVADLYHRTWDLSVKPCLYAGNSQGGQISTLDNDDSVIEGTYVDYQVTDGIFGASFNYNRLESHSCPI